MEPCDLRQVTPALWASVEHPTFPLFRDSVKPLLMKSEMASAFGAAQNLEGEIK